MSGKPAVDFHGSPLVTAAMSAMEEYTGSVPGCRRPTGVATGSSATLRRHGGGKADGSGAPARRTYPRYRSVVQWCRKSVRYGFVAEARSDAGAGDPICTAFRRPRDVGSGQPEGISRRQQKNSSPSPPHNVVILTGGQARCDCSVLSPRTCARCLDCGRCSASADRQLRRSGFHGLHDLLSR